MKCRESPPPGGSGLDIGSWVVVGLTAWIIRRKDLVSRVDIEPHCAIFCVGWALNIEQW